MKKEVKEIVIGFVAMALIAVVGVLVINSRFDTLCENGNQVYCSVE